MVQLALLSFWGFGPSFLEFLLVLGRVIYNLGMRNQPWLVLVTTMKLMNPNNPRHQQNYQTSRRKRTTQGPR